MEVKGALLLGFERVTKDENQVRSARRAGVSG